MCVYTTNTTDNSACGYATQRIAVVIRNSFQVLTLTYEASLLA